ncbi:MAG: hypothetical protein MHPSP_000492, partial [Paramarteilia canceri]
MAIIFQHDKIATYLIENGADPNAKTVHGLTPLHYAAKKCNKTVVTLLLKNGASLSSTSKSGESVFGREKSHQPSFLGEMVSQLRDLCIDKTNITHNEVIVYPRSYKISEMREITDITPLTKQNLIGREDWIDKYFISQMYGETVLLKIIKLNNNSSSISDKFLSYVMSTKIFTCMHILPTLSPVFINSNTFGILSLYKPLPTLRQIIENINCMNNGEEKQIELPDSNKLKIIMDIASALDHLHTAPSLNNRDFNIDPDTVIYDSKNNMAYLELNGPLFFDSFELIQRNPEFVAPEILLSSNIKSIDFVKAHTYSLGALFLYIFRGRTRYGDMSALDVAKEVSKEVASNKPLHDPEFFERHEINRLLACMMNSEPTSRVPIYGLRATKVLHLIMERLEENEDFMKPATAARATLVRNKSKQAGADPSQSIAQQKQEMIRQISILSFNATDQR